MWSGQDVMPDKLGYATSLEAAEKLGGKPWIDCRKSSAGHFQFLMNKPIGFSTKSVPGQEFYEVNHGSSQAVGTQSAPRTASCV